MTLSFILSHLWSLNCANSIFSLQDTEKFVSDDIRMQKSDKDVDERPRSGMIVGGSDTLVNDNSLMDCQQIGVTSLSNSQPKDTSKEAVMQQSQKKRGRKPNSLRKEEEGYDNSWVIGISSSNKTPCRGKNPRKRINPSNSSALAGLTSPLEPGKEPKSLAFSVKNVQGPSFTSLTPGNPSIPENVHSRPQSGVLQKEKLNSSVNPDNGLNLLLVSAGELIKTENEGTPAGVTPKISGSTGNSRGKRKKGSVNTAPQGDAKAKRKRAVRKSEIERTGCAAETHREGIIPTKTDGISSSRETRTELPVLQPDARVQKLGRSAPVGHVTEHHGDGFELNGTLKVCCNNDLGLSLCHLKLCSAHLDGGIAPPLYC